MNKIELPNGSLAQVAEYKEQDIAEYQNPLIEALPPIYSQQEVIDLLSVYPPFNKEERYYEDNKRTHLIQRILRYFQPLPIHLKLYTSVDCLLRAGYVSRNPITKEYANGFVNNWNHIQHGFSEQTAVQTAQTLSIVGISGSGKTRTLNRLLHTYPQVISHTSYQNQHMNLYQISHLSIQTPFDGSVKTIIYDFMYQIDLIMGTNYFKRYSNSRLSTSQLMPICATIARSNHLGLLIIDEIQNLKSVKSKNSSQVLNFFTTLINLLNIPMVMVGTPKAMDIFQSQFRQARRNTNSGNIMWDRLKKDDIWDLFIRGLWQYQWTREEIVFNEELSTALYDASQGIIDIAVKLFMMCQLRSISSGEERITIPLIKKVAEEELKIVSPMLYALRTNNLRKLADYDDLVFPDIEGFLERERIVLDQKQVMDSLKQGASRKAEQNKLVDDAVFRLSILGIAEGIARETIVEVINQGNQPNDLSQLVQTAFCAIKMPKEKELIGNKEDARDLRVIVDNEKAHDLNAYQALKKAGFIKIDYPMGEIS
ncbi:ATP-binding protein [Neobacillus niacini]|uniref:ATP-binding protein n=1 Tax=Neobacillus niacini TaxID=86668 RepID=UPI002FFF4834